MRSLFSLATLLLLSLTVVGCASNQPRFVKPVAAPVDADKANSTASKYQDGYLRIFVSSNLDSTGKMMDFGKGDDRPAMLLISAKFGKGTVASFASATDPEIPVLLYDVRSGKTQSSVVNNALLTEGMLIDPESLSRSPQLQIYVRGVPADKALWVTDLLQLATAEPILKVGLNFVPGAAAFSPLSTKLGSMLSDEIKSNNKPWEEKTLLGLRADEGLASLNGRQFIVLLDPSTIALEAPPKLFRCDTRGSITGLCEGDGKGKPWVPTQAYVRFELSVTDYRSISDFISTATSCEADERVWSDYRVLLASGQLARRQTEYERHLLARGDLLMQIRRSQAEYSDVRYTSRLLQHAQQFALLPTPDDAYWVEHFRGRAQPLDACIRNSAIRGKTHYASIWDSATTIFAHAAQYPTWAAAIAVSDSADSAPLREAESELVSIHRLLSVGDLARLDAQSLESLTSLATQLESMLDAGYMHIAQNLNRSAMPPEAQIAQLTELGDRTSCIQCKKSLQQKIDALQAAAVTAPPQPSRIQNPAVESKPAELDTSESKITAPISRNTSSRNPSEANDRVTGGT